MVSSAEKDTSIETPCEWTKVTWNEGVLPEWTDVCRDVGVALGTMIIASQRGQNFRII
jgi:hypothetical protein